MAQKMYSVKVKYMYFKKLSIMSKCFGYLLEKIELDYHKGVCNITGDGPV